MCVCMCVCVTHEPAIWNVGSYLWPWRRHQLHGIAVMGQASEHGMLWAPAVSCLWAVSDSYSPSKSLCWPLRWDPDSLPLLASPQTPPPCQVSCYSHLPLGFPSQCLYSSVLLSWLQLYWTAQLWSFASASSLLRKLPTSPVLTCRLG